MNAEAILRLLGSDTVPELKRDGYWAVLPDLDVRAMAELMLANGVRLITLTAMPDVSGGLRVMYHWDVEDALVNISTTVTGGSIPTISDLLPAADWVEREIRDYYALEFEGRAETPTLMLQDGDEPGLFSRTSKLGKDTDPARTARDAAAADSEGV
jgi:NADH:ubiquinone oxidoreductase subunit C